LRRLRRRFSLVSPASAEDALAGSWLHALLVIGMSAAAGRWAYVLFKRFQRWRR